MQQSNQEKIPRSSRRGFVTGGIAVGSAAAAAVALPPAALRQTVTEPEPPKPERGGGYRVSEHVKRYYKTTLV